MPRDYKAVRPDYFTDFRHIRSLKTKDKVAKAEIDPEEAILHDLSEHSGWGLLKDYIVNVSDELDKIITGQMESGATLEQIGLKTVTVKLCKEVLTKIINKVEDARESVDERIYPKDGGGIKTGK